LIISRDSPTLGNHCILSYPVLDCEAWDAFEFPLIIRDQYALA